MSVPTAITRVAEFLVKAGYRPLPLPLEIGGVSFTLPAAFLGASPSPDLILVVDTALEDEQHILRKVESIARAMDVLQSKRPLTAVIAGQRPCLATLEAMSRVCRILPLGIIEDEDAEATLRNWLAVLMPLKLPEPSIGLADPLAAIEQRLAGLPREVIGLVKVASRGASAVQKHLHEIIAGSLPEAGSEDER